MTVWLQDPDVTLYHGDCLDVLRELPSGSVHMCATSPPFYGLRDYGTGEWDGGDPDCDHMAEAPEPILYDNGQGQAYTSNNQNWNKKGRQYQGNECPKCGARRVDRQIGLEETPDQWVDRLVQVFREVRRVLRDDGTLWVEIGDSYASSPPGIKDATRYAKSTIGAPPGMQHGVLNAATADKVDTTKLAGIKQKDLLGQPWLLAFALRADGWYLRSEIIWARPNPMPESVTDRPTKSHSTVFLLSKAPRYFYDADAIREPHTTPERRNHGRGFSPEAKDEFSGGKLNRIRDRTRYDGGPQGHPAGANARSVWQIPTEPTPYAHFATWPQALVRRMILAGTSEHGCCPECGAPWERVMETVRDPENLKRFDGYRPRWDTDYEGKSEEEGNPYSRTASGMFADTLSKRREMRGWRPTCECGDFAAWKPCTVLDPFAGSGTTNLVARNHGRHSIGIELNADYLTIAATRLQQLSLLT